MAHSVFNKIPKDKYILENELAFAIYDINPVAKGHILVITKREVGSYFEATEEEVHAIWSLIDEANELLDEELSPDGYNIGINIGKVAGQTVDHLHVHLIPRYEGDSNNPAGGIRNVVLAP